MLRHGLKQQAEFRGNAKIEFYQNHRVRITARLNEPGVLVLTDALIPGGKYTSINTLNAFCAQTTYFVALSSRQEITLWNLSMTRRCLKIGLFISLMTVALILATPLCVRLWRDHVISLRHSAPAQIHDVASADSHVPDQMP